MKKLLAVTLLGTAAVSAAVLYVYEEAPTAGTAEQAGTLQQPAASPYSTPVTLGGARLAVEVADTPEERMRGLSGRPELPENTGMLFVADSPVVPLFWMWEMNFPIDFIWIDRNRTIVGIERGVAPETFPQTFSPLVPVQYVLEVPAGWAAGHGVKVGDELVFE